MTKKRRKIDPKWREWEAARKKVKATIKGIEEKRGMMGDKWTDKQVHYHNTRLKRIIDSMPRKYLE